MNEFLAARRELIETAEPGLESTRALTDLTDEAVRALARAASGLLEDRWAIVTLGSWGSRALLPGSDLDLLVLSDAPATRLRPFVEAVLYPLWDAGLSVGHQARSPRDQLRAAREDLKTCTAGLTGRFLIGDEDYAAAMLTATSADARKRRRQLTRLLGARERPGSPYLLEPDLKDGAGGQRDIDELTWLAAVLTGHVQHSPAALAEAGLLSTEELARVFEAAAAISRARWQLHRSGHSNLMTLDAAEDLGSFSETAQAALGEVSLILTSVRERVRQPAKRRGPSKNALDPYGPIDGDDVFRLLASGDEGHMALELAAQAGRLDRLVPGFRELMSCRRPGLGHRLTVGAHCLLSASLVGRPASDRPLAASRVAIDDLRPVQVACLVHDVGKQQPGPGHAERGVTPATQAAAHFGLGASAGGDVADLVRLHLALVECALHDDLNEEDAILRCAARVGRRSLVAPLHLLTAADAEATGPGTWTEWTAALVATLVARLDLALSPDVDGAGLSSSGERVRAAASTALDESDVPAVAFVAHAPLRYLASRGPDDVVRDARLVADLIREPDGKPFRLAVSDGPAPATFSVTVVAADHESLLARLAGAMALCGLDILSMDAYGVTGHVALDHFVVRSATEAPAAIDRLPGTIERALGDRLKLAAELARRRRHYPARADVSARVRTDPAGWHTAVTVRAADRPGLLHDLAAAVSAVGLDIRVARANTVEGIARDTFHVVGPDGGPVDDPGLLGHLAMRLREAL